MCWIIRHKTFFWLLYLVILASQVFCVFSLSKIIRLSVYCNFSLRVRPCSFRFLLS